MQTSFCVQFLLQEELPGNPLCSLVFVQTCEFLFTYFVLSFEEILKPSCFHLVAASEVMICFPGSFLLIELKFKSLLQSRGFPRKGEAWFQVASGWKENYTNVYTLSEGCISVRGVYHYHIFLLCFKRKYNYWIEFCWALIWQIFVSVIWHFHLESRLLRGVVCFPLCLPVE